MPVAAIVASRTRRSILLNLLAVCRSVSTCGGHRGLVWLTLTRLLELLKLGFGNALLLSQMFDECREFAV